MLKVHNWQDIGLQSLDIILCEGTHKLSRRIQKFQKFTGAPKEAAKISHVANISGHNSLLVQESTSIGFDGQNGCQEHEVGLWLEHYPGRVWVRKLDFERTTAFYRDDWAFWQVHKDEPYEHGIAGGLELLLCGLRWHLYIREFFPNYRPPATKNPHCGELGAKRIHEHQLWNCKIFSNRMPPWIWVSEIDKWLKVPISEPILIKG
ncbi:hypothetical protein LCGC14_0743130 [marine sediment metagenome]|uniref:Uncharacterized protein n=1 Tax=marine sediment metagenome TaxID=412755 RepID=A0A0F9TD60_9ZZZZ